MDGEREFLKWLKKKLSENPETSGMVAFVGFKDELTIVVRDENGNIKEIRGSKGHDSENQF